MLIPKPLLWIPFLQVLASVTPLLPTSIAVIDNFKSLPLYSFIYISNQFSSVDQSCLTLCDPMNHSTQALPVRHQLQEFTQTRVHRVGDAIQPSHSLSSPSPPAPSIRVFSNESALHIRWSKYWNFSFNISPSNEDPRLISFRMDWMDLLVVQGTLKSLLRQHSSKHQFFSAQISL